MGGRFLCSANKWWCWPVLHLWIFRLSQFSKFVLYKSWCACAIYINFWLRYAWMNKKIKKHFFIVISKSVEPICKHTEPKSRHSGLEAALMLIHVCLVYNALKLLCHGLLSWKSYTAKVLWSKFSTQRRLKISWPLHNVLLQWDSWFKCHVNCYSDKTYLKFKIWTTSDN